MALPQFNEPSWLQNYIAEQKASAGSFNERFLKPIGEAAMAGISAYKSADKNEKIQNIIDSETNAANWEKRPIDYRKLERLLLPIDQELSMKYGVLADKQESSMENIAVKREAIEAKKKLEEEKAREKLQKLTNKFDLNTEEGKLAWKDQFNRLLTASYQPGFKDSAAEQTIIAQIEDLKTQAKNYPELLKSVGLSASIPKTEAAHSVMYDSLKENLTDADKTNDKAKSFIDAMLNQGKITADEHKELIGYIVSPQVKVETQQKQIDSNTALAEINKIIDSNIGKPGTGGALNVANAMRKVREYTQSLVKTLGKTVVDNLNANGLAYAEDLDTQSKNDWQTRYQLGKEEEEKARSEFSQYKDYAPAINSVKALESNPNDPTNVQMGVSQLLKIFSGTGVSDQERINFLTAMTSKQFQDKMRSETKGFASALVKKYLIDNQQMILNDVINNVSGTKVASELNKQIPSQAKEWFKKTQKVEEKPIPGVIKVKGGFSLIRR